MKQLLFILTVSLLFIACNNKNYNRSFSSSPITQVDSLPGECPFLTKDAKGNIVLSRVESINDSTHIFCYATSLDGGNSFSTPKRISNDNWMINGCPHTGPAMTENKEGLHFAWFTGGENHGCFYTNSTDNGSHFLNRDSISQEGSQPQLTALADGSLLTAWDEPTPGAYKAFKRIGLQKRSNSGTNEGTFLLLPINL